MKQITIAGAGAFGFAIAKHLSDKLKDFEDMHHDKEFKNYKIKMFDIDSDVIEHMKVERSQKNLFPKIKLNEFVEPTTNLKYAIKDADLLIISIPTQFIRSFLQKSKEYIKDNIMILNTSKGLELDTYKFISDMVFEELSSSNKKHIFATMAGGTIAKEFISGFGIFGAEISCKDKKTGLFLQKLFSSKKLRVYLNDDVIGLEAASALKNVISIAAGLTDGLGYPYGSKTFIVSLGGYEIMMLSLNLGGEEHTFNLYTQAFGNDYIMSTTGNTRNRYFGELIGKGMLPDDAIKQMKKEKKTAEGYYTSKVAYELARKFNLKTPIIDMVYNVIYKNKDPKECIKTIMSNELEPIINSGFFEKN